MHFLLFFEGPVYSLIASPYKQDFNNIFYSEKRKITQCSVWHGDCSLLLLRVKMHKTQLCADVCCLARLCLWAWWTQELWSALFCIFPMAKEKKYIVCLEWYLLQIWAYVALSITRPNGEKELNPTITLHVWWLEESSISISKTSFWLCTFPFLFPITHIYPAHEAPAHTLGQFSTTRGLIPTMQSQCSGVSARQQHHPRRPLLIARMANSKLPRGEVSNHTHRPHGPKLPASPAQPPLNAAVMRDVWPRQGQSSLHQLW